MSAPRTLGEILDAIEPDPEDVKAVSVADVLNEVGDRSFAPMVLVVSVLLVSPLSAVPGTPTIGAMMIILIASQWLAGRRYLWLPDVILRRAVSAARLSRAISWLKPWAAWFDRNSRGRLKVLTLPPMTLLAKIMIVAVALTWPVLELLPGWGLAGGGLCHGRWCGRLYPLGGDAGSGLIRLRRTDMPGTPP